MLYCSSENGGQNPVYSSYLNVFCFFHSEHTHSISASIFSPLFKKKKIRGRKIEKEGDGGNSDDGGGDGHDAEKVIPVEDWSFLLRGQSDEFAISCTVTRV